jgi:hypothetical protein
LGGVYFSGNAPSPSNDPSVFGGDGTIVYYLPGTTGWGSTFDGRPTALWNGESFGALQVSISPASVVSARAQWQVDGGAWQTSGTILANLSVGSHTLAFSTVTGWATPASQTVLVNANQTSKAAGTYLAVSNAFSYTTNDGTITITGYTGAGRSVTIPSLTNGLPVTSIGTNAFAGTGLTNITIPDSVTNIGYEAFDQCTSLAGVTIPNSVVSLGDYAFSGCTSLASVAIPDGVISIGDFAFDYCPSLTNVTIPDSVTHIGSGAFWACSRLTEITVDAGNPAYGSVAGVLFDKDQTTLIQYPGGQADSYTIPNSVTSIGDYSFSKCPLTNVAIPNSVTNIGNEAFSQCTNLASVTIPNSVINIGDFAFYDCADLASVTIPDSVKNIGSGAFLECNSLTAIAVDAGNPAYSSVAGVLFDKDQTTLIQYPGGMAGSYTLPNSVTKIGDSAFYLCASLTTITIPDSVTSIGTNAFVGAGLTSLTIPDSVTNVGASAFAGCTSLTNVTIPNSLTSVGADAFSDCTSLASVTIPTSITSIGKGVFGVCTSLTSVTIPGSVTNLGAGAFESCTSLTNATIPDSVTSLGGGAFSSCASLTSATIPASVTNIGSGAFGGCLRLTAITVDAGNPAYGSVAGVLLNKNQTTLIQYPGGKAGGYTIPNSVTSVGEAAFYYCRNLSSVMLPNSVTNIGDDAFSWCTGLASVTIPDSVTGVGAGAFSWCTSLTSVTIGNSVKSIGDTAFSHCDWLTSVYFRGNAPSVGADVFDFRFPGQGPFWDPATVYYLPGTTGWSTSLAGLPTVLWNPQVQTSSAGLGVRTNQFGFTISGTGNLVLVVEASTNLANPAWLPLQTNTLTSGSYYFSDPQWTNYPGRFYRLRWP